MDRRGVSATDEPEVQAQPAQAAHLFGAFMMRNACNPLPWIILTLPLLAHSGRQMKTSAQRGTMQILPKTEQQSATFSRTHCD